MNPSTFTDLTESQRRIVLFSLTGESLARWREFGSAVKLVEYTDSRGGGVQRILDLQLPPDAFATASTGGETEKINARFQDPLAALHKGDLVLPQDVECAFHAIHNLFLRFACNEQIDEWLIVKQALSSDSDEVGAERFVRAMNRVLESDS